MEDLESKKRSRDEPADPASVIDSPAVKRLRENLLDSLDDDDDDGFRTASSDLDSFVKSFEEEINAERGSSAVAAELASDSGESRPDLGFLLEASDDDLGLPPTASPAGAAETSETGAGIWDFEPEIPSYDSDGYGFVQTGNLNGGDTEFVAIDGLFDYSDTGFWSGDFLWRPEKMPAQ